MEIKDYKAVLEATTEQEKLLRFETFSNKDALELGMFMASLAYEQNINLAIAIRKLNGALLFHHLTPGTKLANQLWMRRKFNTVSLMERSSLGAWANSHITGEVVSSHGLSDADYVFCGGGFPLRLINGELVAVLTVSSLPHPEDHKFLVNALADFLGVKDLPQVPEIDDLK
ncbi:MAG: heme-binding protein [Bifidobacteriaceae bacterium]|jgi:uncharacterized protein (UPF0303 family)|nr:heme-binding protein [Bifidobacteriaceae bacterium]